ncbi:MAG: argininosuccinate lyase, partial [Bacteroidetes bacterium]|nr:argininosuccinate lyase [Bacteroidota bacterium]
MKLWQKNTVATEAVTTFTVGKDREMDAYLAKFDVIGSLAHVKMLGKVGLLSSTETTQLLTALRGIYQQVLQGNFALRPEMEDIHSQVEWELTQQLGDCGKKVHMARSRNDQVLVDIRLFLRDEIEKTVHALQSLFALLQEKSEQHKDVLLPGYTHLQLAMPSSFGLWFGAYAESLVDDCVQLQAAYKIVNKNPLGSAAGYGSSFPIDRTYTTSLLGFGDLNYNVVYAQMGRGKTERVVAQALAGVAETLGRFSMDACLYMNQQFGFISFPEQLTTGSSIMPHKKNPDVFELVRAQCNRIKSLPNEISLLTTNLPSGYHRDLQLVKEHLFPAFEHIRQCIAMLELMISAIQIQQGLLQDDKYKYLFSVEAVNELVNQGVPFRDAYRQIGEAIEKGT